MEAERDGGARTEGWVYSCRFRTKILALLLGLVPIYLVIAQHKMHPLPMRR